MKINFGNDKLYIVLANNYFQSSNVNNFSRKNCLGSDKLYIVLTINIFKVQM